MKTVSIHEAKTHLSRLIREVISGEEIIIAKGKIPVVKIIPVENVVQERTPGYAPGLITYIAEDFEEPLDDFKEYME